MSLSARRLIGPAAAVLSAWVACGPYLCAAESAGADAPSAEELTISATAPRTAPAPPPGDEPYFFIALSPGEQVRRDDAEVRAALDVFRKLAGGDAKAGAAWKDLASAPRTHALVRALENGSPALREQAVERLAGGEESSGENPLAEVARRALARASVRERDEDLRAKALKAWLPLAKGAGRKAVEEMAAGMDLPNHLDQRRAFGALKALGGDDVMEVLVTRITRRWGRGPRNHILIANQRSYIADYDVSGAAYDPVVRSFMTGVVLDNRILAVEIAETIVEHLRSLKADQAVLENPKAWAEFLNRKRAEAGQ